MKKSLVALAFGTMGLGIAEFGMMSVLSVVAKGLDVSVSEAGHFVSSYALGVCAGAPALVFLAQGRPLKKLLIMLMILMCFGNFMAVIAPNYGFMLAARFVSGLQHGGFFGVAGIVAKKLAPPDKQVEGMAVMISGMTFANLVGIPIASYITHIVTWHMLFALVVVWGIFTVYAVGKWIPDVGRASSGSLASQFRFLKKPQPWLLLATIMFGNGGLFCWYSYINPIMIDVAGFKSYSMAGIIIIAGLGMVLGNYAGGRLSGRVSPVCLTTCMIALMFAASLLMFFLASQACLALCLMFAGVFGLFGVSGPEQYLIIENSPGGEILGASSAQIAFNLGNALGAYLGGLPMVFGRSVQYSALPGVFLTLLSLLAIYFFRRTAQPSKKFSQD